MTRLWHVIFVLTALAQPATADDVSVAVASNFVTTAQELLLAFEAETGHEVSVAHGSTGQLYAQILNGAPYDIFLAADTVRPALLLKEGQAVDVGTYAFGRLALVSRFPIDIARAREGFAGRTVALADPTVAPYGLASTAAMEKLRLDTASFRPVLLSNVGQVASVFVTGNADIAFVAASLVPLIKADHVLMLDDVAPLIPQDAALLTRASDNEAAIALWNALFDAPAQEIIRAAGYGTPE